MDVRSIEIGRLNPFGASEQEFMAYALDKANLLGAGTTIDGRPAREHLDAFCRKREIYRESTRLGSLLVSRGLLNSVQLTAVLDRQRESGQRIGEVVLRLGLCRVEDLEGVLAAQVRMREDIHDLESLRSQIAAVRLQPGASP